MQTCDELGRLTVRLIIHVITWCGCTAAVVIILHTVKILYDRTELLNI